MKNKKKLPLFLKGILWSYDFDKLDIQKDFDLITANILNFGTWKMTKWLFSNFPEKDIKKVLTNFPRGDLYKKSYNFWGKILDIKIPTSALRKN